MGELGEAATRIRVEYRLRKQKMPSGTLVLSEKNKLKGWIALDDAWIVVLGAGVEPAWVSSQHFKCCAYTNSAIRAWTLNKMEVRARIELAYEVLQTSA